MKGYRLLGLCAGALLLAMSAVGCLTEYPTPTSDANATYITAGPDGNLWFSEENVGKIGKITTAGDITEGCRPGRSEPLEQLASARYDGVGAGGRLFRLCATSLASAPYH